MYVLNVSIDILNIILHSIDYVIVLSEFFYSIGSFVLLQNNIICIFKHDINLVDLAVNIYLYNISV